MRRWSVALGAVALVGTGAVWATLTLTPATHDFGQVPVGVAAQSQDFRVSGSAPGSSTGGPSAMVTAAGLFDAVDFLVDAGGGLGLMPVARSGVPVSCPSAAWTQSGNCDFKVVFQPKTIGRKTARLVVTLNGQTATATMTGEAIFACRQYLVACNYADYYIGKYSVTTDESSTSGNHRGHWVTTVSIEVLAGGPPTCSGTQNDWEEDWNDGKLWKRSTATGSINGPGLFAIEFRKQRGGPLEYVVSFGCPSPTIKTTDIDHIAGTTSLGSIPSEPAEWRRGGIAFDPQPATRIGMANLDGTQKDPRAPDGSGSGVTGMTTMTWSFHRWP